VLFRSKEAVDLVNEGGAFSISTGEELLEILNTLVRGKKQRTLSSEICKNYVSKNIGSTQVIINKVFNI